jgi:hypothetical protein
MTVHDVEVQPVGAGFGGAHGSFAETGVVGSQQRRRNNHWFDLSGFRPQRKVGNQTEGGFVRQINFAFRRGSGGR